MCNDLLICLVFIQVVVLRDGAIVNAQKTSYEPQCVAISSNASEVAVGGGDGVRDILRPLHRPLYRCAY